MEAGTATDLSMVWAPFWSCTWCAAEPYQPFVVACPHGHRKMRQCHFNRSPIHANGRTKQQLMGRVSKNPRATCSVHSLWLTHQLVELPQLALLRALSLVNKHKPRCGQASVHRAWSISLERLRCKSSCCSLS